MSDLFDKRGDGVSRRDTRTKKEQDARKKSRATAVIVVLVFAVVFVGALVVNSNFIRRATTAITIDGISFSVSEFDYFYNAAIFEYTELIQQQIPDFASAMLPSRDRPLASQIQNHETGATWADFFVERAINNMSELTRMYNAARASGFVMSEEDRENMNNQFDMLMMEADFAVSMQPHIHPTPMSFLQALYGNSFNEDVLRSVLEFTFTAISYSNHTRQSLSYSESELEAFYLENIQNLDVFRFRRIVVMPEMLNPLDFDTGDELYYAQEAAEQEAVEIAQQIADSVQTEEDFIAAALELDPERFADPRSTLFEQQGEFIDADFHGWLTDTQRAYGDIMTSEAANGINVLFFVERDDNNYYMTSMRQILILREQVNPDDFLEGEDDPAFIEAVEFVETLARERAEAAEAVFQVGGGGEEQLIDMMPDFSDDATEGGFYDQIARFPFQSERVAVMRVVPELEEWLFDENRQFGDSELIRTEAFGYHLMFFAGHGENFRHFIAGETMRSRDHADWLQGLPDVEAVSRHWAFTLTQQ